MSGVENLLGKELCGQDGVSIPTESLCGSNKVLGLYFSAHWCPPCRGFTPKLAEFYKAVKNTPNAANFDIIFISSDRDEASFTDYFKDMPWKALPFADRDRKVCAFNSLNDLFVSVEQ